MIGSGTSVTCISSIFSSLSVSSGYIASKSAILLGHYLVLNTISPGTHNKAQFCLLFCTTNSRNKIDIRHQSDVCLFDSQNTGTRYEMGIITLKKETDYCQAGFDISLSLLPSYITPFRNALGRNLLYSVVLGVAWYVLFPCVGLFFGQPITLQKYSQRWPRRRWLPYFFNLLNELCVMIIWVISVRRYVENWRHLVAELMIGLTWSSFFLPGTSYNDW